MPVQNQEQFSNTSRIPEKIVKGSVIFELVRNAYAEKYQKSEITNLIATNLDVSTRRVSSYVKTIALENMFNCNKSVDDFSNSYEKFFPDLLVYPKLNSINFKHGVEILKQYHNDRNTDAIRDFFKVQNFKYESFIDLSTKHFGYHDINALREMDEQEIVNKWGVVFTHLEIIRFSKGLTALFEKYRSEAALTVDMQREFFVYLKKPFPGDPALSPTGTKRKTNSKIPGAKRLNLGIPIAPSASSSTLSADDQDLQSGNKAPSLIEENHFLHEQQQSLSIGQQSFPDAGNVTPLQSIEAKFLSFQPPKNNNTMPNNNSLFQHSLFNQRPNVPPQPDTQFGTNYFKPWRFGE